MKLLTLNTHSIVEKNYAQKLQWFIDAVVEIEPDIIALQEVNQTSPYGIGIPEPAGSELSIGRYDLDNHNTPLTADNHAANVAKLLRERGLTYHWTWISAKLGYDKYDEGMTILSRRPIADAEAFCISHADDLHNWKTRYVLGVQPKGGDWFFTSHMGWWQDEEEPFKYQWERFEERLKARLKDGSAKRIWLMGDFNSPAAVRGQGYDLIAAGSWQDTYKLAAAKDAGYTVKGVIDGWREYLTEEDKKAPGMRIDYIWCSHKADIKASRVIFNGENKPVVSDHFGILVEC